MIKKYYYTQEELYKLIPAYPVIHSCLDLLVKEENEYNAKMIKECNSTKDQLPNYKIMLHHQELTNKARSLCYDIFDHYLYMNNLSWIDYDDVKQKHVFIEGYVNESKIKKNKKGKIDIHDNNGNKIGSQG